MAKLSAPTLNYLLALRTEKIAEFGTEDQQIDDIRKVRELEDPVPIDPKLRYANIEVRDPTIADEIQRVVATMTLNRPSLQVTPARPGDKHEENATKREAWTEQCLWEAGKYVQGHHAFVQVTDAVAGDGGGWSKLIFKNDLWAERYRLKRDNFASDDEYVEAVEDKKKAAGVPFVWLSVDPRTLYPVFEQGRLAEMLEVTRRPLHSTLRQYRLGFNDHGEIVPEAQGRPMNEQMARELPSSLEFIEHWDDTYCTYAIAGSGGKADSAVVIKQWKHGYGRVPYFQALGFTPNYKTNVKVGWGIAQTKKWLTQYLSFLYTVHAQTAARDTFAPMYRTTDPEHPLLGKDGKPNNDVEPYSLGKIHNGPAGSQMQPFPFPETSGALKEQIALVEGRIDRLLTPRVTGQIGSNMEGAGFAINQVLSESKIYQDPLASAIEAMLVEMTYFLWSLMRKKVREVVYVRKSGDTAGWLGCGPEDLGEGVGVEWSLDPERASAKLIEQRYWGERIASGTASIKQATEAMGDNYDEVRFERDLEQMRMEEWYVKYRQEHILKELGRGDLLVEAAELAGITGVLPGLEGLMGDPAMMDPSMQAAMAGMPPSPTGGGPGMMGDPGALAMGGPDGAALMPGPPSVGVPTPPEASAVGQGQLGM